MSFWINDRLGIAFESNEGGFFVWDSGERSFYAPMSWQEIQTLKPSVGARSCSEDEAFAYMKAKDSTQQPHTP